MIGIQGEHQCKLKGSCDDGQGVIFSSDGGQTWSQSSLREGTVTELAFGAGGSVYAAVYPGDLYLSKNNGETWELLAQNISSRRLYRASR